MIKHTFYTTLAVLALGASNAYAQSFTFESPPAEPVIVGGVGSSGAEYFASHWSGKTKVKDEDGTTYDSSYTCISMTQPPNSNIFASNVVCDMHSPKGTASLVFGCVPLNAEKTSMNCMGGMSGKTGSYKDRNGTISSHNTPTGTTGTGQWN